MCTAVRIFVFSKLEQAIVHDAMKSFLDSREKGNGNLGGVFERRRSE